MDHIRDHLREAGARLLLFVEQARLFGGLRVPGVGRAAQHLRRRSRERRGGGLAEAEVLVADSLRDLAPQPRVHLLDELVAEGEALETALVELDQRGMLHADAERGLTPRN